MSSQSNVRLKEAKAAFDKQDWPVVLQAAADVLEYDETNYNALIFKGVALYNLSLQKMQGKQQPSKAASPAASKKSDDSLDKDGVSFVNAATTYQTAIKQNDKSPAAWQGLAEIHSALLSLKDEASLPSASSTFSKQMLELILSSPTKLVEIYSVLLKLTPADQPAHTTRYNNFLSKLADAYIECFDFANSMRTLQSLLDRLPHPTGNQNAEDARKSKIAIYLRMVSILEQKIALFTQQQRSGKLEKAVASPGPAPPSSTFVPKPPTTTATPKFPVPPTISAQEAAAAAEQLLALHKTTLEAMTTHPDTSLVDIAKEKCRYIIALENKLNAEDTPQQHLQLAVDIVVLCKELIGTPEGRSVSFQPFEILMRMYDQSRPAPGTKVKASFQTHVLPHLSRSYVERCVIVECFRRFPTRPLAYVHVLDCTRPDWIDDTDSRDSAREYLIRLMGTPITADVKIPSLLLLARVYRKVNQLNPVIDTCKSLLEAIKDQQPQAGHQEPIYSAYWREALLLIAEAFARSRQPENAKSSFEMILQKEPTNVTAMRGLAELCYDRKDLIAARMWCEKVLLVRKNDLWARARLAWLDALPFMAFIAEKAPEFDWDNCKDEQLMAQREKLMFTAITAKNSILTVLDVEDKNKLERKEELGTSGARFRSRYDAQRETESSFSATEHIVTGESDDLSVKFGFGFGWYEYWVGRIEWDLGNFIDARNWWLKAAKWTAPVPPASHEGVSVAEAAALSWLGKYYYRMFKLRGTESDLDTARTCFETAMRRFPQQRLRRNFLHEGEGDGTILLEAALPLLDILLDAAFVPKHAPAAQKLNEDLEDDTATADTTGSVVDSKAYSAAMSLLTQLSQARHHWALLKLGLCRMRSNQHNLAVASLQNYLRREPTDCTGWIALAHAYRKQGKWLASLKVTDRVESLVNSGQVKPGAADEHALIKAKYLAGATLLKLGYIETAAKALTAVMAQCEGRDEVSFIWILAALSLCAALQARCHDELRDGRYAAAKRTLLQAEPVAAQLQSSPAGQKLASGLVTTWKQIGDIHTLHFYVHDIVHDFQSRSLLPVMRSQALRHLRAGANCYVKAIQLDRENHGLYHDLALNYYFQAKILSKLGSGSDVATAEMASPSTTVGPESTDVHIPRPNEHLLMYDESLCQISRALEIAPKFFGSQSGLSTGLPRLRYLTVKGVVLSEFQRAAEQTIHPRPPSLQHVPLSGHNDANLCFKHAVALSTHIAATSDGYFGGAIATLAWSNMLAHWIAAQAPRQLVAAAAQYARNLNPTDPVPWTALVWALSEHEFDSNQSSKVLVREEMNALEHAIQLSPNLDFAVIILSRLVFTLQRGEEFSRSHSTQHSNIHQVASNLLRLVVVHLERYSNRHGGSLANDIGAVHNLVGALFMRLKMWSAAARHFQLATASLNGGKNAVVNLNLALALERCGEAAPALSLLRSLRDDSAVQQSPDMHLIASVALTRVLLQSASREEAQKIVSQLPLTSDNNSALLNMWISKAKFFAGADATSVTSAASSAVSDALATLASQGADLVPAQLSTAAIVSSASGAIAVLARNSTLLNSSVALLQRIVDNISLAISKLPVTPISQSMTAATIELNQKHRGKAVHLNSIQQKAYDAIRSLQHAAYLVGSSADKSHLASKELLRAVHVAPWLLSGWIKLSADFSSQSEQSSPQLIPSPFPQHLTLISVHNHVSSGSSPSSELRTTLQHNIIRHQRLLMSGYDPCFVRAVSDVDLYPPPPLSGESAVANPPVGGQLKDAPVVAPQQSPSTVKNEVALVDPIAESSKIARQSVHLAPWLPSSWTMLAASCSHSCSSYISPDSEARKAIACALESLRQTPFNGPSYAQLTSPVHWLDGHFPSKSPQQAFQDSTFRTACSFALLSADDVAAAKAVAPADESLGSILLGARIAAVDSPTSALAHYLKVLRHPAVLQSAHVALAVSSEFADLLFRQGKLAAAGLVLAKFRHIMDARAAAVPPTQSILCKYAAAGLQLQQALQLAKTCQFVVAAQLVENSLENLPPSFPAAPLYMLQAVCAIQLGKKAKVAPALEKLAVLNPTLRSLVE